MSNIGVPFVAQPCEATKVAKLTTTFLPLSVLLLLYVGVCVCTVAFPFPHLSRSGHDEK